MRVEENETTEGGNIRVESVAKGEQSKLDQLDVFARQVGASENTEPQDYPSKFLFYPGVSSITNRDLKWREFIALGAAQQANSFRSVIEAVGATVLNYDFHKMTYPDLQYLMYVLRAKQKKPFTVNWDCTREAHMEAIEAGKLDPFSIHQETKVKQSDFDMFYPEEDKLATLLDSNGFLFPGLKVQPANVRDTLDGADYEEVLAAQVQANPNSANAYRLSFEQQLNAMAALVHDDMVQHKTLRDKRKFLENWMDDHPEFDFPDVFEKMERFRIASAHGIKEFVKVHCGACGEEHNLSIRFVPTDFFPAVQPRRLA